MAFESTIVDASETEAVDARASTFMKEGLRLLLEPETNADAALRCFDRALALRSRLPTTVPTYAYGLAACWLNRADVLMRVGGPTERGLALRAYDEAVLLLRGLPLHTDGRFSRRLAIAHQNRALAFVAQDPPATGDAALAFAEALTVLDQASAIDVAERRYLLAVVWLNLANTRALEATTAGDVAARAAARQALALVSRRERDDVAVAEVGVKARHVLCQTIARRLSQPPAATAMAEDVHDATDLADDGLSLVRHWEQKDVIRFRALASDLFRFGALVYARYQPHFLREFVHENMDPQLSTRGYVDSPEMRSIVQEIARFLP